MSFFNDAKDAWRATWKVAGRLYVLIPALLVLSLVCLPLMVLPPSVGDDATQVFRGWMERVNLMTGYLLLLFFLVGPFFLQQIHGSPKVRAWAAAFLAAVFLVLPLLLIGFMPAMIHPTQAQLKGADARDLGEWDWFMAQGPTEILTLTGLLLPAVLTFAMFAVGLLLLASAWLRPWLSAAILVGGAWAWSAFSGQDETPLWQLLSTGHWTSLTFNRAIGFSFDPFLYDMNGPGQNPEFWGRTRYAGGILPIFLAHSLLLALGLVASWIGRSHETKRKTRHTPGQKASDAVTTPLYPS